MFFLLGMYECEYTFLIDSDRYSTTVRNRRRKKDLCMCVCVCFSFIVSWISNRVGMQ